MTLLGRPAAVTLKRRSLRSQSKGDLQPVTSGITITSLLHHFSDCVASKFNDYNNVISPLPNLSSKFHFG